MSVIIKDLDHYEWEDSFKPRDEIYYNDDYTLIVKYKNVNCWICRCLYLKRINILTKNDDETDTTTETFQCDVNKCKCAGLEVGCICHLEKKIPKY